MRTLRVRGDRGTIIAVDSEGETMEELLATFAYLELHWACGIYEVADNRQTRAALPHRMKFNR